MKKSIFVFLLFPFFLASQKLSELDSLLICINNNSADSLKADVFAIAFTKLLNNDIKKARLYADSQLIISKKVNYKRGIFSAYMNIGNTFHQQGDYPEALKYYLKGKKMAEEINTGLSMAYTNLGLIYAALQDHKMALDFYFKSLNNTRSKDTNRVDNKKSLAIAYDNIGNTFQSIGNFNYALIYNKAGFEKASELGDKVSMSVSSNNIGFAYFKLNQYGKALDSYLRSLNLAQEAKSLQDIAEAYINLGILCDSSKKRERAFYYYETALKTTTQSGNKLQRLTIYRNIISLYGKLMDYKNKAFYLDKYIGLNDSIYNEEKSMQLTAMRTKFESEEKEKENLILFNQNQIQLLEISRKNYFMFGLAMLIIVIILISVLLFRQNKLKSEQTAIQLEQKLLRSQMNPHFIFNALATIESFIYENQPKEAGRYLSDFARLMRLILENSSEEYITLEKEIKTLEYYLSLQNLRLENNLIYTIDVADTIDASDVLIPPMLTQPFIENAIEHGFRGSKQTGEITISFKELNNQLVVEVKDNGIGINKAKENEKQKEHKSLALQITKERLAVLNRSKKQKLSFSVSDISDESQQSTGTKVIFSIPL